MTRHLDSNKYVTHRTLLLMFVFHLLCAACSSPGSTRAPADMEFKPSGSIELDEKYRIQVVYFVASDRQPAKDYQKKIEVWCTFLADFYRRSLSHYGLEVNGPVFKRDKGQVDIAVITGKHTAVYYGGQLRPNTKPPWETIDVEVEEALGSRWKNCYLIFAETYEEGEAPFEYPGGLAYGARWGNHGGVAVMSAWLLRDEFSATSVKAQLELMRDDTPIPGRRALGDGGRSNSPRYQFIEDGYGALVHELGHVFGLPHDHRDGDIYIMGNGFREIRRFYAEGEKLEPMVGFSIDNARVLAFNRFLHGRLNRSDHEEPTVKIIAPASIPATQDFIPMELAFEDDQGLGAYVVHMSDGDTIITGEGFSSKQLEHRQKLRIHRKNIEINEVRINVILVDRGGNFKEKQHRVKIMQSE